MEETIVIVPCAGQQRLGCRAARRAAQEVAAARAGVRLAEADAEGLDGRVRLLAIDGSRDCRASKALAAVRLKPARVLYLPELAARERLLVSGTEPGERESLLAAAAARALLAAVDGMRAEQRQEQAYFADMAKLVRRLRQEEAVLAAAGSPSPQRPAPPQELNTRLERARRRFRNIFTRCDELIPPARLASAHDLFQDAALCYCFAVAAWQRADPAKARELMDKARVQMHPLLEEPLLAPAPQG